MRKLPESHSEAPKMVVHTFHIAEEEKKELFVIGGLFEDNVYHITVTGNSTDSKWFSIHNTKTHHTVEGRVNLQR